ncbi:MAG TPA: PP2C family protein-serine/threonine phosphatase [Thermoanaerobaculia bacterium]|nr:PP2C family protein-serine/threonine phosphatase [Thermoanaerobaculia bacterium]
MKRFVPWVLAIAGAAVLLYVLPLYRPGQPRGIKITRPEARKIADKAARQVGIPVDDSWSTIVWAPSPFLGKELRDHPRRDAAWEDPIVGPRMRTYRVTYYPKNDIKNQPLGFVWIGGERGSIVSARRLRRPEDVGKTMTEAQLRPMADAFVNSRPFRAAPNPVFESARPTVQRNRTDWVFRYRVPMTFPLENVVPYLNVYYAGDQFMGWMLAEEYADGRFFKDDNSGELIGTFAQFITMFVIMLILLIIFLRKYHAGEVGVGAASAIFVLVILLLVTGSLLSRVSTSDGTGFGQITAAMTSWVATSFKILFADLPQALMVFLAWAVGESYARERWGDKVAAFEAIARRDPFNATVGRGLMHGALLAPAVGAAALGIGAIPILLKLAYPSQSGGSFDILYAGGPAYTIFRSAADALSVSIAGLLFLLAWTHKHRLLFAGVLVTIALGTLVSTVPPAISPLPMRLAFGFGGILVAVVIFLASDLLTATTALFGGSLIAFISPLLYVAKGALAQDLTIVLVLPLLLLFGFGVAAVLTKREVVYTPDDLAPHVKRIIERERVKAEIDAANRIQGALLPLDPPQLAGATFSSHYRAATEIGGDYFDFLYQPTGEIGIAFGDVSGHGLTSGIVMAMAKSALLVQVDYDSSPRAVLEVLNDIVIKTAPKRILMTFFFGLLDPRAQTLKFSSAGHLDPYVYRASSKKLEELSSWGYPLGVRRRGQGFPEHTVAFEPGDRLVLYSDGLIEAIDDDGEPFGFERFAQTIVTNGHLGADDMKKALLNAVRKFTRNRPPEDDQTLVVVAFEEVEAGLLPRGPALTAEATPQTVH